MTDDQGRQEVVVTDIHMSFTSMIVFMVKWALASIPAVIILVLIAAALWTFTLGALFSPRHSPRESGESISGSSAASALHGDNADTERVAIRNIRINKTALGGYRVTGELKNTGDRTLNTVELTVYGLDSDAKPIFEKTAYPVLVSTLGFGNNGPLKSGYERPFDVSIFNPPSSWNKQVSVKVTKVEFE